MTFSRKYRLYIEHEDIHTICGICDSWLDGYTAYHGHGVWHGKHERCYIVETISSEPEKTQRIMFEIARAVKMSLKQESVLMTVEDIWSQFV